MLNLLSKEKYEFSDLLEITRILRSEDGCPWDREQTHESIRMNFLEETYEACEAIDNGDPVLLCEELGDVLAQVVFHSELEKEAGRFDISDVTDGVCRKFIGRHPHVFGDTSVKDSAEVLKNWDDIKRQEKSQKTHSSAMDSVARSLPSLMRAEKLHSKAKKAGVPQRDKAEIISDIKAKLDGELDIGDILFDIAALSKLCGISAEQSLDAKNEAFINEFKRLEEEAERRGASIADICK